MKYPKRQLGKEIKLEIEKGYDIVRISRWAFHIYFNYLGDLDESESDALEILFRMEDDPQFELNREEICEIADNFILEGEKEELAEPIPEIRKSAEDLGDDWLMCPLCQEAWQSQSIYGMVECPQCKSKIHNPKFKRINQ
jgi:predicted Zn-ribbon and HTH transcriptional regulator